MTLSAALMAVAGAGSPVSYTGLYQEENQQKPLPHSLEDVLASLALLVGGAAVCIYFMMPRTRSFFVHPPARDFPEFSKGLLFVLVGLPMLAAILFVLVAYISCATGGECM